MRALVSVNLDDDDVAAGLQRAEAALARLGAVVDLLHVTAPAPPPDRYIETRARLSTLLQVVPASRRGEVEVTRSRDVAGAIAARAERHDLVVVVTRARRGFARMWEGSVAELVVRASPVPVLVVGPTPAAEPKRRILVAVDFLDDHSGPLLERVASLAKHTTSKVDLLAAVPPLTVLPAWLPFTTPASDGLTVDVQAIKGRLGDLAAPIDPKIRGEIRVELGDPATVVAAAAQDYDLVIVGTHGRSGLGRVMLGSVAERVVRYSPVPVLVVPAGSTP
jgi:nucleotide-binding universal stress UspA family protein